MRTEGRHAGHVAIPMKNKLPISALIALAAVTGVSAQGNSAANAEGVTPNDEFPMANDEWGRSRSGVGEAVVMR
jgi:hypothetical protein